MLYNQGGVLDRHYFDNLLFLNFSASRYPKMPSSRVEYEAKNLQTKRHCKWTWDFGVGDLRYDLLSG